MTYLIVMRCRICPACKRVEAVKQQSLAALAQADVKRMTTPGYSVGEDVRLIWNRTLQENPCEATKCD